jgi:hypothetical protein
MEPANLVATECKMARAALGIGVQDLAVMAGVSPDAVFRLEKGETLHQRTVIAIREALELEALSSLTRTAEVPESGFGGDKKAPREREARRGQRCVQARLGWEGKLHTPNDQHRSATVVPGACTPKKLRV